LKKASCLVWLVLATVPGITGSGLPADQSGAATEALRVGAYALAAERARAWCAEVNASHGPDSIEFARATDLLVEALIKNGEQPEVVSLAERSVRTKEALPALDRGELAASLDNLGAAHDLRGEFRLALPLHERSLAIRRQSSDTDAHIADSLDAVATTLIELAQFPPALQRLEESLRIRERESGSSPIALARTLTLLGRVRRESGDYTEAATLVDRALVLWANASPEHPEKAPVLILRGYVYYLQGDVPNAHRTWTEAMALATRTLPSDHPIVAQADLALAVGEKSLGNLADARRLQERALNIDQSRLQPCQLAPALNDLANTLTDQGDYIGGRHLYDRERVLQEGCLGRIHPDVATTVYNQFTVARAMGAVDEATALGYRAIDIWTKALGATHPFVAYGSSDVADFEASQKHYAQARVLFERALRIRRERLGRRHPDVALTLTQLAKMQGESGQVTSAFRSIREAIDILIEAQSRDPDLLARALAVRGSLEQRQGQHGTARATFAEALARRERLYGPKHPLSAEIRSALGAIDFELGSFDDALAATLSAEQIGRDVLRSTVRSLPERRAMQFAGARPHGLDLALSIGAAGHASSDSSAAIFDSVIRSRGVILEELAARARPVAADPQIASRASNLSAARARFANLTMRSVQGESVEPALLEEARKQKEDAESALAEQSVSVRSELAQAQAGLEEIRRALPPASALVSFARYDRSSFARTESQTVTRHTPSYIAFVLRADAQAIAIVPLGTATAIERAIADWRQTLDAPPSGGDTGADAERAYRLVAGRLRASIWDPLSNQLQNVSQIFLVPDGAISTVSFASLPAAGGGYLIEHAPTIHYLTTERDLLTPPRAQAATGLLAIGDPDFGTHSASSAGKSAARSISCGTVGGLQFDDLPGARAEAREIANLWGSDATVLTGPQATKVAVIRMVEGRRVVHLATHGFFLDSPCDRSRSNTRAVGGLVRTQAKTDEPDENPLLLSGLAFAGANRPTATGAGIGDAILTAEEIVGLKLQDAEWVVLSACDTGLGAIRAGEGVFGLRRAFQIAGARTVIMSLWSVDDQATRLWMRSLYEARITQHMSTAQAVRAAGMRVLNERRAQRTSTHPFYWAAFVAAGDWR
jgi:CHAT domain-containing protein/tetratricopeptide (TPR) repeat protein